MLLTFPIAGLLICTRRPGSRIGWLLMATGLSWILSGATTVADYGLRLHPGSIPAADYLAVLGSSLWVAAIGICGTYLLLLFPDGRLPSRRWRWVLHLSTFVIVGGTIVADADARPDDRRRLSAHGQPDRRRLARRP